MTLYSRRSIFRGTTYRITFRGYEEIIVPAPPSYTVIPYEAQYRFPYFANNVYHAGIINIPAATAASMATVHDKIRVLNTDYDTEERIYEVTDKFPAPYLSRRIKLQAVNGDEYLDIYYVIDLSAEPKGTLALNTGDDYYWDTPGYVLPVITQTDSAIISEAYDMAGNLINMLPIFDDTGDINKYGVVSVLNIMYDNYGIVKDILTQHSIDSSAIDDYVLNRLPRSWRTKDIGDIYYSLDENEIFAIVSKYGLTNFSKLEFVLYYVCDIYRRLFV